MSWSYRFISLYVWLEIQGSSSISSDHLYFEILRLTFSVEIKAESLQHVTCNLI